MNKKQFQKYLDRDHGCLHCGETEAVAPHHRLNRGMGGKNAIADQPSNIIVICSVINGLFESDPKWQVLAWHYGWKLKSGQDPNETPVFDQNTREWYILDTHHKRKIVKHEGKK